MISNEEFSSVFDYSSAFKYDTPSEFNLSRKYNRKKYMSAFAYHAIPMASEGEIEMTTGEKGFSAFMRNLIIFLVYFLAICSCPLSAWICIKRIHALERIVLMRLGKLQPIRMPGFTIIFPFIDVWTRVDLRTKTFSVASSEMLTADGGIVDVQADIEYQISDVIKYVMQLHDQDNTIKDMGLFCLKNVISEKDLEDLEQNKEIISCIVKDELNNTVRNWGLEISYVYIHTVKILKAAEPVNAVGMLMTALKSANGFPTHDFTSVPLMGNFSPDINVKQTHNEISVEVESPYKDYISKMQHLADNASSKGLLSGLTASFKFDIVGHETKTVYCCVKNGQPTVFSGSDKEIDCQVSVMMTEDYCKDFLSMKLSPVEAFLDGKIMVTGDWSLMRSITKIFEQ